jgi:ribosomal protein S18 acetylase RimI-like enzyme
MRHPHIREADDTDLVALVEHLGQREYFTDRLARQAAKRGILLTAWQDARPLGDVYLWLEPAEEPEIRDRLPGVPLLTHLEVHRDHRHLGLGTALVGAAERELADQGHDRVALAVEQHNDAVARFYDHLGFREWPFGLVTCLTHPENGEPRMVEICRILVKGLS